MVEALRSESFSPLLPHAKYLSAAIKVYASDLYGGMLWKLDELPAQQVMNCWFTTVKDVWGVTRATHTATARWLACDNSSFQEDLLARWAKYFQSTFQVPRQKS